MRKEDKGSLWYRLSKGKHGRGPQDAYVTIAGKTEKVDPITLARRRKVDEVKQAYDMLGVKEGQIPDDVLIVLSNVLLGENDKKK